MAHLSATCNHSHFARLFQKQLIQVNDFFFFLMKMYIKADLVLPQPEKTNCLASFFEIFLLKLFWDR